MTVINLLLSLNNDDAIKVKLKITGEISVSIGFKCPKNGTYCAC